jgi:sugar/nucleoside kinase (ribokinase family)
VARVVVVGSVALDEVLLLPEPLREGGHLDARRVEQRLGGGGANTAVPLSHAGHQVALVSAVGSDQAGARLLDELRQAGVDLSAIVTVAGPTTRSVVLVDPAGERTIVNLWRCQEASAPSRLSETAADVIYVRSREQELGPLLVEVAERALVIAHVPPCGPLARPAHVLVGSASDLGLEFLADPWVAGQCVAGALLRWVVVTRGRDGAQAFSKTATLAAPAPSVRVADTTGAGDTFAAGLVHALAAGESMRQALTTAVAWGSAAVGCRGIPSRDVIRELLSR